MSLLLQGCLDQVLCVSVGSGVQLEYQLEQERRQRAELEKNRRRPDQDQTPRDGPENRDKRNRLEDLIKRSELILAFTNTIYKNDSSCTF